MNILMRADDNLPVEIQMFDSGGRQIRTYKVTEVKSDAKGPYAAKTEIDNPVYKSRIVVEVLSREFPGSVEDTFFTGDKLKQIAAGSK